tara:strand:- start:16 stop:330 length:315 start_codon:yes stop_codon:yes gene_type:complete
MIQPATNGYNNAIIFLNKQVYFDWNINSNQNINLGKKINIEHFITNFMKKTTSSIKKEILYDLLLDWTLYENGWLICESKKPALFYYLCQITYTKPKLLTYFNS